jgi:hypothetical protein
MFSTSKVKKKLNFVWKLPDEIFRFDSKSYNKMARTPNQSIQFKKKTIKYV